ncbi:hypothetical protein [Paenibacillus sp. IITD108]|uniref:hypothetical protein n=1 Tax=Paenibacillus sp. IITD108 TaxID=3116649 RepID=UPI002F409C6D
MLKQLALALDDEAYLLKFSAYFRRHPIHSNWTIIVFTSAEACMSYIKKGGRIDYLIAGASILKQIADAYPHLPAAVLAEQERGKLKTWPCLLKYQPLPQLLQKALEIYSELTGASEHVKLSSVQGKAGAQVIVVYSVSGNIGKTAIALHLAHAAGVRHSRVFYLNMERWNCFELWLGGETPRQDEQKQSGMSELLYSVKRGGLQSSQWLEQRKRHKLLQADYVLPFELDEDWDAFSGEEAAAIVELAAGCGHYDVIVIDLDSGLGQLQMAMLDRADVIVWVVNGDQTVLSKQLLAMQYMMRNWPEQFGPLPSKLEVVFNGTSPRQSHWAKHSAQLAASFLAPHNIIFPDVEAWRVQGEARLLSSADFRAAADRLLQQIIQRSSEYAAR